jgi:hypothetical protein
VARQENFANWFSYYRSRQNVATVERIENLTADQRNACADDILAAATALGITTPRF